MKNCPKTKEVREAGALLRGQEQVLSQTIPLLSGP